VCVCGVCVGVWVCGLCGCVWVCVCGGQESGIGPCVDTQGGEHTTRFMFNLVCWVDLGSPLPQFIPLFRRPGMYERFTNSIAPSISGDYTAGMVPGVRHGVMG
jgi:hypothetical protein